MLLVRLAKLPSIEPQFLVACRLASICWHRGSHLPMLDARSCALDSSAEAVDVFKGAGRRWGLGGAGAGMPVYSGAESALAAADMRILCSGSSGLGELACLTGVLGCAGLLAAAGADADAGAGAAAAAGAAGLAGAAD